MPKVGRATKGVLKGWEDEVVRLRQQGYQIRGTPEKDGKPRKEGIVEILEAKGVVVTFSQIELLLKKLGERKYLSGNEWAKVIRRLDIQESAGAQCSVLLNGTRINASTLRRNRRRYYKELRRLQERQFENTDLPDCIEVQTESQGVGESVTGQADGATDTAITTTNDTEPVNSISLGNTELMYLDELNDPTVDLLETDVRLQESDNLSEPNLTSTESQLLLSQQSTLSVTGSIHSTYSSVDNNNIIFNQSPFVNDSMLTNVLDRRSGSPFLSSLQIFDTSDSQALALGDDDWPGLQDASHASTSLITSSRNFDDTNSEAAALTITDRSFSSYGEQGPTISELSKELAGMPSEQLRQVVSIFSHQEKPSGPYNRSSMLQKLEQSLLSLVPLSKLPSWSTETETRFQGPNSSLQKFLIFSIENNLADNFQDEKLNDITALVLQDPQLRLELKYYLLEAPRSVSVNLAGTLLKAAIESGDAGALTEILAMKLLDINSIVFTSYEDRFTAIERSAKLRHFKVTQELITAGADVNKTYETKTLYPRGALENALYRPHSLDKSSLDMNIVDIIFHAGAIIQERTLDFALQWGNDELTAVVLSKIPPSYHYLAFQDFGDGRCQFDSIIDGMKDDFARIWIKSIIQSCYESKCGICLSSKPKIVKKWIKSAIKKGLTDVVEFLIQFTPNLGSFLTYAITHGQNTIAELFLQHGADIDHYTCELFNKMDDYGPATPLGEAIRTGNKALISTLEARGAFTSVTRTTHHLQAALNGAAEAGDLFNLKKILDMAPRSSSDELGAALSLATREGHDNISMLLLKMKASVNYALDTSIRTTPLYYALERRNGPLVRAILERDVFLEDHPYYYLQKAVEWGDLSILKDLMAMYGPIRSPVSLDEGDNDLDTPLSIAILHKDMNLVRCLLDSGADVLDSSAFCRALKDQKIFHELLAIFSKQYPRGVKGFGSKVLKYVMMRDDIKLLETTIRAGFDINGGREHCLEAAISNREISSEMVTKLLEAGADPDCIVRRPPPESYHTSVSPFPQETALLLAISYRNQDVVMLLIKAGADIHKPARLGFKRTPLQQACEVRSIEIVELLLSMGASPNEPPAIRGGATALQLTAISGCCGIAERLLGAGADVHAEACEVNGRTAIEGAAEHGRFHMLQLLWNAAGSQGFEWEECKSAIRLAKENGHLGCGELIQELYTNGQKQIGLS